MPAVISWTPVMTVANTSKAGTSGTVYWLLTNDTAADLYVDRIEFKPFGTNVATVARLFISNGQEHTDAANVSYVKDITLDSTTDTDTAAFTDETLTANLEVPPNYRLFVTLGTSVAAGWKATAFAGAYKDLQSYQGPLIQNPQSAAQLLRQI